MIKSFLESKLVDVPWPIYIEDKLIDGEKFSISPECIKCKCLDSISANTSSLICEHGFSYVTRDIQGVFVTVAGVFIPSDTGSSRYKKNVKLTQRKITKEALEKWFITLKEKSAAINSLVTKTAKNNFDQFHEFVKWAREIEHYSERLLKKSSGATTTSAFDNASEDLKSLYKTSVMLLDSLDTTALYFNPSSACFGRKKLTDIHGVVHKIKSVLSHSTKSKGRVNITIKGRVEEKYKVYESFKIIPLSLLQNAIKYKRTGDVEVVFDESDSGLLMAVNSIGHYIDKDEISCLFNRGFRTKKAREMSVEGCGLGLYVLKIVSDAHEFDVKVTSTKIEPMNKNLARNSFIVSIN